MRQMQAVPEVRQALQENKITLTTAAHVARHKRQENLNAQQTAHILDQCLDKSTRQVDEILLQHSSTPVIAKPDHLRQATPDHARLSIDCDAEMLANIKMIQELSTNPSLSVRDAIKQALSEKVTRLKHKRGIKSTCNPSEESGSESSAPSQQSDKALESPKSTLSVATPESPTSFCAKNEEGFSCKLTAKSTAEITESLIIKKSELQKSSIFEKEPKPQNHSINSLDPKNEPTLTTTPPSPRRTRFIPANVRRLVFARANHRCQYQDPKTNHRCTATRGLHVDHIHPFALGGTNTPDNLQILCATHNRLKVPPLYRYSSNQKATNTGF